MFSESPRDFQASLVALGAGAQKAWGRTSRRRKKAVTVQQYIRHCAAVDVISPRGLCLRLQRRLLRVAGAKAVHLMRDSLLTGRTLSDF